MPSLIKTPISTLLRASDKLCFTLQQEDVGEFPVTKQGIYRLKCVDTDKWLMKQPSMFRGNKPLPIDLMDIAACRLRTKVPKLNELGIYPDTTAKKQVQLHYGESINDIDNCENNKCELTDTSDIYTIVNSYCPQYELDILGEGHVLASMAKKITICRGTSDWIWVCGQANITIEIKTTDGQFANIVYETPTGINYISIGPENINIDDAVLASGLIQRDKISCIKIYQGSVLLSQVTVIDCCCKDCSEKLYFLDPKGSIRGAGIFDCAEIKSIQSNGNVICRQSKCDISIDEAYAYYGDRYLSKETWERITIKKKVCVDKDNEEFFRAMSAATTFWIQRGNLLLGFIPESRPASYNTNDGLTEFVITGYISNEFPTNLIN